MVSDFVEDVRGFLCQLLSLLSSESQGVMIVSTKTPNTIYLYIWSFGA